MKGTAWTREKQIFCRTYLQTPDVERAEFHLGLQGTEFLEHTRKVDDKGRTKAIYLNQTFAGFAVHLMRK